MNVFRSFWLYLVIGLISLGGCGKNDTSDNSSDTGLKVRYTALASKVRGLDPGDVGDVTSSLIASQSYDTLYQYHYLKRPYEIIPSLAASMPTISADGLTYTIPIRQDVFFFDDPCFPEGKGRQLKAEDFIYSWKRIANIKYLSKNWWVFDGRIVGLDEFREYTKTVKEAKDVDYTKPVEGLTAIDDFTLQIQLEKPWPQIELLLAHLPTAPVPKEAVDHYGDQFMNFTVGTGPFILKSWNQNAKMIFERNPKYRSEPYPCEGQPEDQEKGFLQSCGKPMPFVDRIEFTIVEESQPYWLLFMQGKIDAAGIPKDFYNQAITTGRTLTPQLIEKGIDLIIQEDPSTFWFGFNMEDPVVGKNVALRRAMSCAWNQKEYIEVFNNNRGVPAKGVFPPMFKEYDPEFVNPWSQYDPDRARQLLQQAREANHGQPLEITLSLPGTDTMSRQMGQFFQRSMKQIGLEVKVDYLDWPTLQDRVKTKSIQIFAMGWSADYPDGESFLQIFYGPNESPGPNNFNYHNPEFDRLYEKVSVMADSPERIQLYRQMERMICDDAVVIFSYHPTAFVPYYKYLKNYKPHAFGYGLTKYHDIDLALRKELVGR